MTITNMIAQDIKLRHYFTDAEMKRPIPIEMHTAWKKDDC